MKLIGETTISEKYEKDKTMYFLKVREYNRDGSYNEAEVFCRLTKMAQEQYNLIKTNIDLYEGQNEIPINIKDSFYTVDKYYKGEDKYTKATIVLKEIENI